jgi:hypothetical protein
MDFEVKTSEEVDRIHMSVDRGNLRAVMNMAISFPVS